MAKKLRILPEPQPPTRLRPCKTIDIDDGVSLLNVLQEAGLTKQYNLVEFLESNKEHSYSFSREREYDYYSEGATWKTVLNCQYPESDEDFNKRQAAYEDRLNAYNAWYTANQAEIEQHKLETKEAAAQKLLKQRSTVVTNLEKQLEKAKKLLDKTKK